MRDEKALIEEIEEFRKEKQRIKDIVGEIGGNSEKRQNKIVNMLLLAIMIVVLIVGVALQKIDLVTTLEVAILDRKSVV